MAVDAVFHEGASNLPKEFLEQYDLLRQWFGLPNIPLKIGLSEHGAHTDMASIEMGVQMMAQTLRENYHGFKPKDLDKIAGAATYFVLAHEIAHNTTHPGREVKSWENSVKDVDVEARDKFRWMNIISDICINYNIINGMNLVDSIQGKQRQEIADQMRWGLISEMFMRHSTDHTAASAIVNQGKNAYGQAVLENRVLDDAGVPVALDDPALPLWQRYQGYGRGDQIYPSLAYSVINNQSDNYRKVQCIKGGDGRRNGKTYLVTDVKTYDGRTVSSGATGWEPIKEYMVDGAWQSSRYFIPLCPDTGKLCPAIWDGIAVKGKMVRYWWAYVSKADARKGTSGYEYLGTQLFLYEWCGIYATNPKGFPKFAGKTGREAGEAFIDAIADDMDRVMRYR